MALAAKPPAEVTIDIELVQRLLREQHPDLASFAVVDAGEGWDNKLFRLGEHLAVRMPRRNASVSLIEQEQRWLPELSARLTLPIPAPVRKGRPGCGYPWPWSVVPWLPGKSVAADSWDPALMAADLGQFLNQLHRPAPDDAPRNPWRGVPLAARTELFERHLGQVGEVGDKAAAREVWELALSAQAWAGPPLWIHGDLHPGNLLAVEGRLSAVIDFGDLAAGDPATDLAVAWVVLPPATRPIFWSAARSSFNVCDQHTKVRARGWALALGLAYLCGSEADSAMRSTACAAIRATLDAE